ncbi:class I SAM-dependent methyltransferase [Actinomycetospora endophytica]|uniref:Class I SAM-dependent methyltransferase n=1 Tax=Actinomycetospora endophytica TaxID=2291215 RepID=A0ABS8PH74_9PSEU|nr:class I SAM-dependent methyltransferase [Actinomycetospora endophytica]MCD2197613.1 class I SAM-dependent methyltransferase [Actinomycetospora endophytica]
MRRTEKAGLAEMRRQVADRCEGKVLEVGAGTGANIAHYPAAATEVTLTEPDVHMMRRLERRARDSAPSTKVLRAPAEDLPFEDGAFDTVVSTLVLCGVDDAPRAVRELRRVLRPGGRLLFLEHVRATDAVAARKQDRMNRINRALVCCDCNRPTLAVLEDGGFTVTSLAHTELPKAPSFVRPVILGEAVSPSTEVDSADRSEPAESAR